MNEFRIHAYRQWPVASRLVLVALVPALMLARPASAVDPEEAPPPVACSGWTPFQFAVWNPVQLFDENTDVYGLRMSLFYGRNRDIYGMDFSLFSNNADDIYGLSILGFGNELLFGCTVGAWAWAEKRVPNIHGVQIGGGAGAGFILYPYPIGAAAALVTKAGNVDGAQISLLGNHAARVRGIQIAGLANYVEGGMTGLQLALIGSKTKGEGTAIQIGVFGNATDGNYGGCQLGLGGNDNQGDYAGLSLGLVIQNTYGHMRGYQMSGEFNFAGDLDGVQTSAIFNRVRGDAKGVQVGLINRSDRMKGVQIGAINYSRQMTGIQIGGINIIKEGGLPFMVGINASMSF